MSPAVTETSESLESLLLGLLTRLEHLPGEYEQLRDGVQRLAKIADGDPEMALTRARKILELVIYDVYMRRFDEPSGKRDLVELIDRLFKEGQIPPLIQANAHYVRNLGNVGTHGGGPRVTLAEVGYSLRQLMPVIEWYVDAKQSGALDRKSDRPPQDAG
ncbi:MAG TPA: DUF4145 domain-containing protein, partial [Pirellulales bacterium]|nr:DUF4145 domain-containing protein [Pirellulales bacterium]